MARLIGPSEASRLAFTTDYAGNLKTKKGRPAIFYLDAGKESLADVLTEGGAAISGSSVTIDSNSMIPLVQFPDGVDTLYVSVDGGDAWPVYAREDDRFDSKVDLADSRLARVYTPEMYGATGSATLAGAVDATTAIQSAIDAASTNGGVVLLTKYYGLALKGSSPNKTALTLKPNVVIRGIGMGRCGLKLLSGQGSYSALLMPATLGTNVGVQVFEDFDIDANTAGNPVANLADVLANRRFCIGISVADDILARRVRVTGHTGLNTFYFSGTQVKRVTVQDNQFLDIGVMPDGEGTDHSTVYTGATGDVHIAGNTFEGTSPLGAHAAIETHHGRTVVSGNKVYRYGLLANITGVQAGPGDNVVFSHNVGTDLAIGVALYSMDTLGGTAPGLRNVSISDNQFTLDRDYHLPYADDTFVRYAAGVSLFSSSNLAVENINIHNNQIYGKTYSAAANIDENVAAGVIFHRTNPAPTPDINVRIAGNTIVNMAGPGVRVSSSMNGLRILDNTIINPGGTNHASTAGAFKVGVIVSGTQTDCDIDRNLIVDNRSTHLMTDGIYTATVTAVTNGRARGNVVRFADGASIAGFTPASGTGKAFYLEHEMETWLGLFQPVKPGSRVRVRSTGAVYVNTNATDGGAPSFVQTIAGKITMQSSMITTGTTPGSVVKKIPVYDATGITVEGYLAVYSAITG